MIIISACLAGVNCRYDKNNKAHPDIIKMIKEGNAIPLCPEQLGGLPTPREPTEIINEHFITKYGNDVTKEFQDGAKEALRIAQIAKSKTAILKSNSPSCGCGKIYDGTFSGNRNYAMFLLFQQSGCHSWL